MATLAQSHSLTQKSNVVNETTWHGWFDLPGASDPTSFSGSITSVVRVTYGSGRLGYRVTWDAVKTAKGGVIHQACEGELLEGDARDQGRAEVVAAVGLTGNQTDVAVYGDVAGAYVNDLAAGRVYLKVTAQFPDRDPA